MSKLEFFFDFISPFSYVAWHALPGALSGKVDRVEFRPMFLGAVMKETGNLPPGMVPAKGAYMQADLVRCCKRHGIGFRMHPSFPMMDTRPVLRAACGLSDERDVQKQFVTTIFHHVWAADDPLMTDNSDQVRSVCRAADLPADRILMLMEEETTKASLRKNTQEALDRGVFGAPSVFVGDELFFGHDRLDYAAEALKTA